MNPPIVHIAELEFDPDRIDDLKAAALENITSTLESEPGALEFHAVVKRGLPGHAFVFESYVDQQAYQVHIQSAHYKKFGSIVASMVKKKVMHDTFPVILGRKPSLASANPHVRIAEIEIELSQVEAYKAAVIEEITASVHSEPGVLAIFCVALKEVPNMLRFLEVYADESAYLQHRGALHFTKYLEVTKPMIRSLNLFDADPVTLGMR